MRKASEIEFAFSDKSALDECQSFFLVGIGGAGMSAIARMLSHRGYQVNGSDSTLSPAIEDLQAGGISVQIGHDGETVAEGQALVLSDAIELSTSPEVKRATSMGLKLFRRSQVLGWLLRGKKVIAVTGSHGKTTTTGMIGHGLAAAGLDPTVVVGAAIPEWGSPVREGEGEWAVAEACEAYDSFHDLKPTVIVLTNLEADHLDFHQTYTKLEESVLRFVKRGSVLIYAGEDRGALEISRKAGIPSKPYSAEDFVGAGGRKTVWVGQHNALNAAGALLACLEAGADPELAVAGIAEFQGAERRLQILREGEITVIDDYAHHPTEIEKTIEAIRGSREGRLIAVFQPHLYSRTRDLIQEFAKSLSLADVVVLTDIYPSREEPIPGVSAARIAELVDKPCYYIPSRHLLQSEVAKIVLPGDIVLAMGAGNISEFGPGFVQLLNEHSQPTRKTRVAVFYGGDSAEREVSLISGQCVQAALALKGYDSFLFDVTDQLLGKGDLSRLIGPRRPDIVFLAVHGSRAEDGAIQGLCELLHLPYTGSRIRSSALAMDKESTKMILRQAGLPVAQGVLLSSRNEQLVFGTTWHPVVVKPNAQGSTVGLSFVEREAELAAALDRAFAYDSAVLVEEWLVGVEISVPVLGNRVLPVVEIVPATGKYDYASKYLEGATEEIIPARLTPEVTGLAQEYALRAHNALGCAGATRTDMIVVQNKPYILEVNTLPGMTRTSLLPNSAANAGIAFPDLVDWIVQDGMVRYGIQA